MSAPSARNARCEAFAQKLTATKERARDEQARRIDGEFYQRASFLLSAIAVVLFFAAMGVALYRLAI